MNDKVEEKQTVSINKKALVKKLLKTEIEVESEDELLEMLIDKPITIDVDKQEDKNITKGERLADKLSEIAGSWGFIIGFLSFLIIWIVANIILAKYNKAPDAYPFILLNLILSCLASLQAPIIMMSQNRQAKKDSLRNQNDYQIDLKSELILEKLHDRIEEISKNQKKILALLEEDENKK